MARDGDGTISAEELGTTILRYGQLTPRQFGLVQGMGVYLIANLISKSRGTVAIMA